MVVANIYTKSECFSFTETKELYMQLQTCDRMVLQLHVQITQLQ